MSKQMTKERLAEIEKTFRDTGRASSPAIDELLEEIGNLRAEVANLPEMADGTRVTGGLIGRDVWTWGFPGMCLSSFTVKQIRSDGESWEFVGTDGRYMEQVAMSVGLCCLSEESAEVAREAKGKEP